MNVTKITIGRLFNLGSYEHVRYDITVEVKEGESSERAIIGLEKIVAALAPERHHCVKTHLDLKSSAHRIEAMRHELQASGEAEFRRRYGHFEGSPEEYIARCLVSHNEDVVKRQAYEKRAQYARELLDNVGGAVVWKDCKLDWEDQYGESDL